MKNRPPSAKPLAGRTVLVTRAREQASELTALLSEAGAEVVHCPAIEIVPPESYDSLDEVIESCSKFDWIAFTSINGVEAFVRRASETGRPIRLGRRTKIAAVGGTTAAALERVGIKPDAVPKKFQATELLPLLGEEQRGVRTAVVRAEKGRDELIDTLRARGGEVHLAIAYRTVGAALTDETKEKIAAGAIHAVTFTSPSTVENLLGGIGEKPRRALSGARVITIGPITSGAVRAFGVEPVEAKEASVKGLFEAVIAALTSATK